MVKKEGGGVSVFRIKVKKNSFFIPPLMACLQIYVWNGHQVTLHALRASINWGTTAPPPRGQVMPTIFEQSSHEELPNIEAVPLPLSPVAFHCYCDEVNKM